MAAVGVRCCVDGLALQASDRCSHLAIAGSHYSTEQWGGTVSVMAIPREAESAALAGNRDGDNDNVGQSRIALAHVRSGVSAVCWVQEKALVTSSDRGVLDVWSLPAELEDDTAAGHSPLELEVEGSLEGHDGAATCVNAHASPNRSVILSGGEDGCVCVWTESNLGVLGENRPLLSCRAHENGVSSAMWHPGTPEPCTFASVGYDGMLRLWDTRTKRTKARSVDLRKYGAGLSVAIEPTQGRTVLVGTECGAILAVDDRVDEPCAYLRHHTDCVQALAFTADGKRLAAAGDDGELAIWTTNQSETFAAELGLALRPHKVQANGGTFIRGLAWGADREGHEDRSRSLFSGGWDTRIVYNSV
mmetsp:Transcript_2853/g.10355  ORF Transcript_2853/g.10355 Transcript_2853/m.10355 type:complete len:361 (-) Transcript_2853:1075-2157(-)